MSRSPLELLDAVLDEVEGLRRTDARSFLPAALVRELRKATEPPSVAPGAAAQRTSLDDLVGRVVSHVFDDDLQRGDAVLMCADGGFVVLEAESDGDSAYLRVANGGRALNDFLRPRDLVALGLMTQQQQREAEKQEQIAAAQRRKQRALADLNAAEAALAKLKPPTAETAPGAPASTGSVANG